MKNQSGPPRGTRDLLPEQVAVRDDVLNTIVSVYGRFGYQRIETPVIEDISRLQSGQGGENEKLMFQVLRRGLPSELDAGTSTADLVDLGLRYDLTMPLSRYYAHNRDRLPTPFRSLQIGPVWRAERPQRGRYRQFYQCDIDMIGESGVLAEAELIEATSAALGEVGLQGVVVRLWDRRFLTALAAEAGLGEADFSGFFVALDKLDKIGREGVTEELVKQSLPDEAILRVFSILDALQEADPAKFADVLSTVLPSVEERAVEDFAATTACLERLASVGRLRWRIDPTLVRGMGYYTGQIFEMSHPEMSGSIAGGGRYDRLIGRESGRDVPACGFSIGFERIVDLLERAVPREPVVLLFEPDVPLVEVLATARSLRGEGRAVEAVPRSGKFAAQLERLEKAGFTSFLVLRLDGEVVVRGDVRPLGTGR